MHFAKKEMAHGKAVKVCSFILAMLIICSMLVVGNVGTIEASAAITSGNTVYVCFYKSGTNNTLGWWPDDADIGLWGWNSSSSQYNRLAFVKETSDYWLFRFTPTINIENFQLLRFHGNDDHFSTLDKATAWNDMLVGNGTQDAASKTISAGGYSSTNNCVYIKSTSNSRNDAYGEWGSVPDLGKTSTGLNKGGVDMTASIGYQNGSGEYKVGSTELYPVSVVFYDYLTDYEKENGWRTNDDYETSRTYRHRIPYTQFNSYISNLTGGENGNWAYPLYFGNFTTTWTSFASYPYGSLVDKFIYDVGVTAPKSYIGSTEGHLRHENKISNYTNNSRLNNFSIFANDSEPLEAATGDYTGSVQGLVMSSLKNDKLYMTTKNNSGIESPYFKVTDYTNVVTTKFPMRVNSSNSTNSKSGTAVTYTTYEFDSGGKSSGSSDIVYFDYKTNGKTDKIYYTRDSSYEVTDAYKSLGGNDGDNHKGFFPFDNGGIGYDYGFGMRLDIDFNLTEDGYIIGEDANGKLYKTNVPMQFTFEGDDDVWAFVDGDLALDLGGDHGNASGYINFALDTQKSYVTTGAVTLKSSPAYGTTEYDSSGLVSSAGSNAEKNIGGVFDSDDYVLNAQGDQVYDVTKTHTLTLFYMERGLVESNLKLSFSISPIGNRLTTEKTIDDSNVNPSLQASVEALYSSEDFTFTYDDSLSNVESSYVYTKSGESEELGDGASIKHGELIIFDDQFTDGAKVTVSETPASQNNYTYDTYYTVTDSFKKQNGESNYTIVDDPTDENIRTPNGSNARSVEFDFSTTSTEDVKFNSFAVSAINKIKTGKITLKKTYASNSDFNFTVKVKVPGASDYVTLGTYTVTANAASGNPEITGIPLGSEVVITENVSADDYTTAYVIGTGSSQNGSEATINSLSEDTTVTFTNTDVVHTVSATVEASKTLDGEPSTEAFNFSLTPLTESSGKYTTSGDALTASNGTSGANVGKIKFEIPSLNKGSVYYYLLKETSTDSTTRRCDDKVYIVEIDTTGDTPSVSYYNASKSGSEYTLGTAVTSVIFANTTIPQYGSVKVTKKGSNNELLEHVIIALVKAENKGTTEEPDWQPKSGAAETTKETTDYGIAQFDSVEPGEYVIYEKKSVSQYTEGYELYGKYVHITVTENHETTFEMIDPVSTDLPKTGGAGVLALVVVGVILVSVGVYLLRPSKKKETK